MISKIETAFLVALALLHTGTRVRAAEASEFPLWQKAVALARTNANWVPGLTINRSEVIYKGESAGMHEIWTRSTLGEKGEVLIETVKVLDDGKDVTKAEKKKNKTEGKQSGGALGTTPFNPNDQGRLSLKVADRARTIAARDCLGYFFELKNTNTTMTGTAWLDKQTGVPLEIEDIKFNPLPDKHLKRMSMTIRYESTPEGGWRAKEMVTTGSATMLLMTTDISNTVTYSEHWRKPMRRRASNKSESR